MTNKITVSALVSSMKLKDVHGNQLLTITPDIQRVVLTLVHVVSLNTLILLAKLAAEISWPPLIDHCCRLFDIGEGHLIIVY